MLINLKNVKKKNTFCFNTIIVKEYKEHKNNLHFLRKIKQTECKRSKKGIFMNINAINSVSGTKKTTKGLKVSNTLQNSMMNITKPDCFQKQRVGISFTGKTDNQKKDNLVESMADIGFVGGGLLLSIAAGIAFAKFGNYEEYFLDEDGYQINLNEKSINSNNIEADSDDGIFKAKELGIDINPDRFSKQGDTFDPENGIYKTADGNICIDLKNNVYKDIQNGIFVDPNEKISAFVDENGNIQKFQLPAFGSGYPLNDLHGAWPGYPSKVDPEEKIIEKEKANAEKVGIPWDVYKKHLPELHPDEFGVTVPYEPTVKEDGIVKTAVFKVAQYFNPDTEIFGRVVSKDLLENTQNYRYRRIAFDSPSDKNVDTPNEKKAVFSYQFKPYDGVSFVEFEKKIAEMRNNGTAQNQNLEDISLSSLVQNDVHRIALNQYISEGHTMQEALADSDGNGIPDFMEEHAFYKGELENYISNGHTIQDALADDDGNGIPNFMEESSFYKESINAYLNQGFSIEEAFGDLNGNGIPDFIENNVHYKGALNNYLSEGHSIQEAFDDADDDGIPDFLQSDPAQMAAINAFLNRGFSIEQAFADDDGDGIPNYLDEDMDGNGIPDYLEQ